MPKKGNKHLCIFSDFTALRTWGLPKSILLLSATPRVPLTPQCYSQHQLGSVHPAAATHTAGAQSIMAGHAELYLHFDLYPSVQNPTELYELIHHLTVTHFKLSDTQMMTMTK